MENKNTELESEDVETRSEGAAVSGIIDNSDIQPRFEKTPVQNTERNEKDEEVERLLNTPLEDRSIIGSGEPGDPTTSRGGGQTLTDVR